MILSSSYELRNSKRGGEWGIAQKGDKAQRQGVQ